MASFPSAVDTQPLNYASPSQIMGRALPGGRGAMPGGARVTVGNMLFLPF